jgi:hypothetical protein
MQKHIPPSDFDVENELNDIIKHGDKKPIAALAGFQYDGFCRSLRSDDPTPSCVHQTLMLLCGTSEYDKSKARAIFAILYRYALTWELVDEEPVDIVKLATDRLRLIKREDIEMMTEAARFELQGRADELEREAANVKSAVIVVRRMLEGQPRMTELSGNGRVRA